MAAANASALSAQVGTHVAGGGGGSCHSIVEREALQEQATTVHQGHHDDFLKATMRIFLVVSPPMGRVQVKTMEMYIFKC